MVYNAQQTISKIQELVKRKNDTQKRMLAECGLSENMLKQMKDRNGMASFNLAKIADYLDCSVDYLLGRTDNPEAHKPQNSYVVNNKDTVVNGTQANIINSGAVERDVLELVDLIQSLPIVKRAEAILAIEEIKNNN